jgi:hypothetical protein
MAIPEGFATFPGCVVSEADITISRGITPAMGILRIEPQDGLTLQPGTLRFTYDSKTAALPDCKPLTPFLDEKALPRSFTWLLPVLDHRWRWAGGQITGEYNKRLPDGTVDPDTENKKTPQQLATLLLTAMGEIGFNVGGLPNGVFPYVKWEATNPARALAALCERCACEITGGERASVVIWPRGVGFDLPASNDAVTPRWRMPLVDKPARLVAICGETVFQSQLVLLPIGQETDGELRDINDVSFKPEEWTEESFFGFPQVQNDDEAAATFESLWRWFAVERQAHLEEGFQPPEYEATQGIEVTEAAQLKLRSTLIESADDAGGTARPLSAWIEGLYWPYCSDAVVSSDRVKLLAPFTITSRGTIEFPFPIIDMGEDEDTFGEVFEPLLYLTTSYTIDGARITRTRDIGGTGGDFVIRLPEVFDSIRAIYDGEDHALSGTVKTTDQATLEADAYLDLWQTAFAAGVFEDREYVGILEDAQCDGRIAQVKFQAGKFTVPTTRMSTLEEFDQFSPSAIERRRNEALDQLREHAGL